MNKYLKIIEEFVLKRPKWKPFHSLQNIAINLSVECGELLEIFSWKFKEINQENLKDEIGDVLYNTLLLCLKAGIDPEKALVDKLEKINQKYPEESK